MGFDERPYDEKDLLGYADPAQYIGLDDRLLVQAISRAPNQVLTITCRILTVQGKLQPIQFTVNAPDALTLVAAPQQLAQGFLVGIDVRTSETIPCEWWTYVKIGLTRGGGNPLLSFQPLMAGYVGNAFSFGYPRAKYQRSTDGPGVLTLNHLNDPDLGGEVLYACPSWTRQKLLALSASLITSDAMGDRQVTFSVQQSSGVVWQLTATGTQAPSLTTRYNAGPAAAWGGSSALGFVIPLPYGLTLDYNTTILTTTANLDPADQWSAINVLALEWADWE